MGKTLLEIARQLKDANKKVQLIYAFNGTGKTRLSRELKKLICPKLDEVPSIDDVEEIDDIGQTRKKFLYYNAFTEDLFYWDNDLEADAKPKLKIQRNSFTNWLIRILKDQGSYQNIITNFQRYANDKITPKFNEEYKYIGKDRNGNEEEITVPAFSEATFSIQGTVQVLHNGDNVIHNGDSVIVDQQLENIKISKGEESNLIWSIFYTLLEEVISILDEPDPKSRPLSDFDQLEYICIDDPVSSLDENHLIQLAVDLALLIKSAPSALKFVITTHNPLFYNVLWNELNNDLYRELPDGTKKCIYKRGQSEKYRLDKKTDGTFELISSNDHPFSYHLFLLSELKIAIHSTQIKKYHFNFLRNILEKTATFLGYKRWEELLIKTADGQPDPFANRILNLSSHSAHAGEEVADIEDKDKEKLDELVKLLTETYRFYDERRQNG